MISPSSSPRTSWGGLLSSLQVGHVYRTGLDTAHLSISCSRKGDCDPCLCPVGKLIKLRTREVGGRLSYNGNSNFGGCILTGILYTVFTVSWYQSNCLSVVTLNASKAQKLGDCLCSLYRDVTCVSFLKHEVSLSGILWTGIVSVLPCAPPPAFTVSIILLCVGTPLGCLFTMRLCGVYCKESCISDGNVAVVFCLQVFLRRSWKIWRPSQNCVEVRKIPVRSWSKAPSDYIV